MTSPEEGVTLSPTVAHRIRTAVGSWSIATKISVCIIVGVWTLRFVASLTGWYIEDDFIFKYDAVTQPLSVEYLMRSHYGNLMPGALLVEWIRVHAISAEYWSAAAISATAFMASALLLLRLLQKWVTSQVAIVVSVAWFSVVLLTAETQFWWAAALNGGLMMPFILAAALASVSFVESGRNRDLILSGLFLLGALLMFQKAVSVAWWVLIAYWVWRTLKPQVAAVIRQRALKVVGVGVGVSALYFAFYVLYLKLGDTGELNPKLVVELLATAYRLVATTAAGGPWSWWLHADGNVSADPSGWGVLLATELVVIVLAASIWLRRRSWVLIAASALCFAGSAAVLLFGRAANPLDPFGAERALDLRYSADLVIPLAIALALLFSPAIGEIGVWRQNATSWLAGRLPSTSQGRGVVVFVIVNALVVSAAISWRGFVDGWGSNEGGEWATAASREINKLPPEQVLVNQPSSGSVRKNPVSEYALTASVLAPFVPQTRWAKQTSSLTVVDGLGFVGPGVVDGELVIGPTKDCGWKLTPGATDEIKLTQAVEPRQWLFRMGYLSGATGPFKLQIGAAPENEIVIDRGLSQTFTALEGGGDSIKMQNLTDSTVCVSNVSLGLGRLETPPKF